jgi:hypothetical protein
MPLPPPGTVLDDVERERIHAAIARDYSASLMSDTKWRKLFGAVKLVPSIDHYIFKFVRLPNEVMAHSFIGLWSPYRFVDTFSFGPIYLREIEWIEFPRLVPMRWVGTTSPGGHHQDLAALQLVLDAIGQFPLEDTPRGLRVIGHVPRRH